MNFQMLKKLFLIAVLVAPFATIAQTTYQVRSHEITIDGTSNLQSWSAEVEKVSGTFQVTVDDGKITKISNANLRVDATSIKGSEGRRMDSKINETLDTRNHPNITFSLRDINSLAENPGTFRVNASGVLTIAGVSRTITLNTVGKVLPNGDIEFSGSQVVKMSDHGMSPPTALLGALRTGDEVTVNYKVVLNSR
jgi:polyisoprenoid-binding protein YceI